jgi:hypothetical protein
VEIVSSTSAKSTILKLARIFATHGIPKVLKSDNGPPFQSYEFSLYLGKNINQVRHYGPKEMDKPRTL